MPKRQLSWPRATGKVSAAKHVGFWFVDSAPSTDPSFSICAGAGNALKREKIHQHTLGQTQAQIGTLESQILAIEDATINSATLEVIENAAKSMKRTTNHLTIEKVEKITYAIAPSRSLCGCGNMELIFVVQGRCE